MTRRIAALSSCFAMILCASIIVILTPTVKGSTLIVNETGDNGAYTIIQDAIDDASHGDTVFVYNGTYNENVIVNKTINLTGEDRNSTIIHGDGNGDVINVTADWVNISGFTITGVGIGPDDEGIELNEAENCTIADVEIFFESFIQVNYTNVNLTIFGGETIFLSLENNPGFLDIIQYSIEYSYNININNNDGEQLSINITNATPKIYITNETLIIPPSSYDYPKVNCSISIEPISEDKISIKVENLSYYDNYTEYAPRVQIIYLNDTFGEEPYFNLTYVSVINGSILSPINYTIEPIINITPITILSLPSQPTNLTASAGDSYIKLTWDAQFPDDYPPIINYTIYRGTTPGNETFLIEVGNITYYKDTNITYGVTYFYRISATNALGEGPLSNGINMKPLTSPAKSKHPRNQNMDLLWILWLAWSIVIAMILVGVIVNWGESRSRRR